MVSDNFGYGNSVTPSSQSKKEIDEMLSYCLLFLVLKTVCFPKSQVMRERLLICSKSKLALEFSECIKREMYIVPLTGRSRVVSTRVSILGRSQRNFSLKDQLINILSYSGHTVFVTAIHLCHCSVKTSLRC